MVALKVEQTSKSDATKKHEHKIGNKTGRCDFFLVVIPGGKVTVVSTGLKAVRKTKTRATFLTAKQVKEKEKKKKRKKKVIYIVRILFISFFI